jgi:hypothetical protein
MDYVLFELRITSAYAISAIAGVRKSHSLAFVVCRAQGMRTETPTNLLALRFLMDLHCKAILAQLNMDDGSDEIFHFYYKLIEKRSNKINDDQKSLMKQTMKVYVELVGEEEKRKTLVNDR